MQASQYPPVSWAPSPYFLKPLPSCPSTMTQTLPPLLKAVRPHTLPDIASPSSSPDTHCSFQILQTTRTFVSNTSSVNVTSDAAVAAQGRALSDRGQCWHTSVCTLSSRHLRSPWTDRQEASGTCSCWQQEREMCVKRDSVECCTLCLFLTIQKVISFCIHGLDAFQSYK